VIKPGFIKAQVGNSAANGETSNFLRQLVLSVVDAVAMKHYGSAYPLKCLQVSAAIQAVLNRFGIGSRLWLGAVCVAEVFDEAGQESWGGFWGGDHHVWLVTDYLEYVDLSISQCHLHPRCRRQDGVPIPPIWWSDVTQWPTVLRYLPDSPIKIGLEGEDAADLNEFLTTVMAALDRHLTTRTVQDTQFRRLLSDAASMNEGFDQGNPWLVRAIVFQEKGIPFPAWIRTREQELRTFGPRATSRLAGTSGEFGP
jgi:hypothetical protein